MTRAPWEPVMRSPVPGMALRLVPGLIAVIVLLTAGRMPEQRRFPFPVLAALVALVVLSNLFLLRRRPAESMRRAATIALLVFVVAGGLAWFGLPGSALIVLPFWAARVAVRYNLPGRAELAVVVMGIVGASVPIYLNTDSITAAIGTAFGVTALVLASINRRNREEQLEELEVSLARKQAAIEEHSRAAALAERARIARDVHDVLAHSLAGLSLSLQGARLMLVRDGASPEAIEQVNRARGLAAEGLAEARRAVAALRDDAVPDVRALGDLVTAYRLESGALADFEVTGTARELPSEVMNTLYRTVQEALANTRKHAPGAPVSVSLAYRTDDVTLTVEDRPGRPPARAAAGGYGLLGMRERADLVGGVVEAGPTAEGWKVRLVVA
ncbi:sensor histidine kinase [Kribbella steppae]|nr:histidine kinase [Kribbella steppae]